MLVLTGEVNDAIASDTFATNARDAVSALFNREHWARLCRGVMHHDYRTALRFLAAPFRR
jgi:hypothetical protein